MRNAISLALILFGGALISKLPLDASQAPVTTPSQVDFF